MESREPTKVGCNATRNSAPPGVAAISGADSVDIVDENDRAVGDFFGVASVLNSNRDRPTKRYRGEEVRRQLQGCSSIPAR